MNKIIRTFHPVGQGAFYSERHENFNVVYDCGTEYPKRTDKGIKRTVETAFRKDEEIDILFISHFDFDHVGHIDYGVFIIFFLITMLFVLTILKNI